MSLIWQFNLTAVEQLKSVNFHVTTWKKLNHLSSNYDNIGTRTFVKFVGSVSYNEPRAPHIEIDRNDPAHYISTMSGEKMKEHTRLNTV